MANMSYCRFRNTARDLEDCFEMWNAPVDGEEAQAKKRIIQLAKDILEEEGYDVTVDAFSDDEDED